MAVILHIDTAATVATVSIAMSGIVQGVVENKLVNEHASFIQPAIQQLLDNTNLALKDVDAIAVAIGPGSYTGLRVGLASAKGLSYALNKPLITIGTLPMMAHAAAEKEKNPDILYAPMIDARRMEVFTSVFDSTGKVELPAIAKILTNDSFVALLLHRRILFFGTGAKKFQTICNHINALFSSDYNTVQSFAHLSFEAFTLQQFAELAYAEPLYLKEFYTGA
ncbi:MAG: tRNA (adenosine(37)-N6)-threonylcarbamoyltransferase complex dimerization subunit type 1 TsaB [Chitinophagaceae bacterium]|nr:MAG: tRNA (adenosine(37)-N6)-threonylcarbamoyltransferase complex dimerization subunit type 1 TsaB [Chitinophagaceae bacterium]